MPSSRAAAGQPATEPVGCTSSRHVLTKENSCLLSLQSACSRRLPGGLLSLAILFFIIAILAYVLGARGVAGMSAGIGRTLLFVFLVLAIIFVIVGFVNRTVSSCRTRATVR